MARQSQDPENLEAIEVDTCSISYADIVLRVLLIQISPVNPGVD